MNNVKGINTYSKKSVEDKQGSNNRRPSWAVAASVPKQIKNSSSLKAVELAWTAILNKPKEVTYSTIKTVYAQIMGVTSYQVVLNCLIDKDQKKFQIKKFDKTPFEDAVDLTTNNFVEVKIFTRPGERKFTYRNIDLPNELKEIFEPEDLSHLFDPSFFNPISES